MKLIGPCPDCIHREVCAVRATLDADVEVSLPSTLLTARVDHLMVDCSAFLDESTVEVKTPKRRGRPPKVIVPALDFKTMQVVDVDLNKPWAPLCMTDRDYRDWQDLNEKVSGSRKADRPCADCPLSYATEMRSQGKCNGSPGDRAH